MDKKFEEILKNAMSQEECLQIIKNGHDYNEPIYYRGVVIPKIPEKDFFTKNKIEG